MRENREKSLRNLRELDSDLSEVARSRESLRSTQKKIVNFYVFGENFLQTEVDLRNLKSVVDSELQQAKDLISSINNNYLRIQQLVPSDLAQELNSLELLTEEITNDMEEKAKEFKKARTVRSDYITEVKDVQNWIKDAELIIQDRSIEPHVLNEHLQNIQSEILSTSDLVEQLMKNGRIIMEKTRDDDEKKLIQSSIDNINDQMQRLKSLLDEKKQQVGGAQDAWKRFLALHEAVMKWVDEKQEFLREDLVVTTLSETKHKLHEYAVSRIF